MDRPHTRRRYCRCEWLEIVVIEGREVLRCHFCRKEK